MQVQDSCQAEELLDFLASSAGSEAAHEAATAAESLQAVEQVTLLAQSCVRAQWSHTIIGGMRVQLSTCILQADTLLD